MRHQDLILFGTALLMAFATMLLLNVLSLFVGPLQPDDGLMPAQTESIAANSRDGSGKIPFWAYGNYFAQPGSQTQSTKNFTAQDRVTRADRLSAMQPNEKLSADDEPPHIAGQYLELLPQNSPAVISLPGVIQFLALLTNPNNHLWQVRVEAIVTHADGSKRSAITPRTIWVLPGQTLRLPIKFRAREPRYQPGFTLFEAIIKDLSGNVIDRASIAFVLEKTEPHVAP